MNRSTLLLAALAAVTSRRRSFRVELVGFFREPWSLEFETGFRGGRRQSGSVRVSGRLCSRASNRLLRRGLFQSRGSAPNNDLADQISRGSRSLITINRPERVQELGDRGDLALLDKASLTNILFLSSASANEGTVRRGAFVTTRWSLILSGGGAKTKDQATTAALAELCSIYWRPIFAFICRRGHSTQDAEDLTQDFFLIILEGVWLQNADPSRGRFRSLLLKSLKNFLNDASDKTHARKRGGAVSFISWDDWMAEAPSELSMSTNRFNSLPPDRLFDVRWAATVVERAIRRLREECELKGQRQVFDVLSGYLTKDREDVSYASLATELEVPESTAKKLLYRMRQRHRWLLRDEVAQTVENPADIDDELRHLCGALAASAEQGT